MPPNAWVSLEVRPSATCDVEGHSRCDVLSDVFYTPERGHHAALDSLIVHLFADRHRCSEPPGTNSFGHTKEYITSRLSEAAMDVLHPSEA